MSKSEAIGPGELVFVEYPHEAVVGTVLRLESTLADCYLDLAKKVERIWGSGAPSGVLIPEHPLLTWDEQVMLAQARDTAPQGADSKIVEEKSLSSRAINLFVEYNQKLCLHIAMEYTNTNYAELADNHEEGILGLYDAAKKFEPRQGVPFSHYSAIWIRRAISRRNGVSHHF